MAEAELSFEKGSRPLDGGDPSLWGRLIDAVDPATLLAFVRWNMSPALRRQATEEDVLQEGLLYAWRSRGSFQWSGLGSFRRWLLQILRNRIRDAADHHGALKRGGEVWTTRFSELEPAAGGSEASAETGLAWASTTPSRMVAHREQADRMQRALSDVPDELREVVRLRLFEERTMDEIARTLDLGVEAVRHRFRKGARLYGLRLARERDSEPGGPAATTPR